MDDGVLQVLAPRRTSAARVRGVLDRAAGRELRGRVFTRDGDAAPQVTLNDDGVPLGEATVRPALPAETEGAAADESVWAFAFRLPAALYDGTLHTLRAEAEGHPAAFGYAHVALVADPAILRPAPRAASRRRDRHEDALVEIAQALREQSAVLARPVTASTARLPARDLRERYGAFAGDALRPASGDVIWFGVIDWDFRIQRPQHLAMQLAEARRRVLYVSIVFEPADERGRFVVVKAPYPGVYEVRLRLSGTIPRNIYGGFDDEQIADIQTAVDEMIDVLGVAAPTVFVQFPSWYRIACGIAGATVVHDCLDLVSGFTETAPAMVALERELAREADLVVVTSEPLAEHVRAYRADPVLIRNAADVAFFAAAPDRPLPPPERPVIGYFGAISYWFETAWIEHAARARPDWRFVLVGASHGCDVSAIRSLANVELAGERPYAELPGRLGEMDVAIIPFQLTELITCTNPVKLYEYMAAGRPVVASAMPEVVNATDLVYIANDAHGFVSQIERALREDSAELRERRRRWAAGHTWQERSERVLDMLQTVTPPVSVVILAYDNWSFTRASIDSVLRYSEYANLELIVVDNGSSDETPEKLRAFARREPRLRVISNETNRGFAGGNNAGIVAARGEYVILLNNDTYVTRGWIRDLIRPLVLDRTIGLAGPLTNNMGNEQKVDVAYSNMPEMAVVGRRVARRHTRERLEVDNLAFFCVAMRRDVIERVGLLDEAYGIGFYEDDDYCRRVKEAGYRIAIADDVFVHHHLSASFNALGAELKQKQMERNRAIYEARWGPWQPHKYRDAPGFG